MTRKKVPPTREKKTKTIAFLSYNREDRFAFVVVNADRIVDAQNPKYIFSFTLSRTIPVAYKSHIHTVRKLLGMIGARMLSQAAIIG